MSRAEAFAEILSRHDRVALCGPPRSGKSTLASTVRDRIVVSTDAYLDLSWEAAPLVVMTDLACAGPTRFVLEGVRVPWVLRAGLEVDAVVWLQHFPPDPDPHAGITAAAGKVFEKWLDSPERGGTPYIVISPEGAVVW